MGDGGKVIINGKLITGEGQSSNVHITETMSLTASTLITIFSIGYSWYHAVAGELVGGGFLGAVGGIVYYATELFSK